MQASNGEISGPTHIIEADPISRNAPRQKQDFIYQKTVLSLTSSSSNCSAGTTTAPRTVRRIGFRAVVPSLVVATT